MFRLPARSRFGEGRDFVLRILDLLRLRWRFPMIIFPSVPPVLYLILSGILFTIGVIGALTRRNAIIVFMCIEMMLSAVNLTFITLSRFLHSMDGVLFAFFVMVVAAAEAAVGLAIFVMLYRSRETINLDEINLLKW
jgi:NADH-quinone oxidoreductase subunit K